MRTDTDVAIVGGGAAGLATAIFLRRLAPRVRVTVFDGARRPGAKIIVSGGGRCNVTNAVVTERDFWGGPRSSIRRVLRAMTVAETVEFFAGIGVPLKEEPGGKLFPVSDRSRDVSAALLRELERVGAVLEAPRRVTGVVRNATGFTLQSSSGITEATCVVLATGGLSLPKTGSDGAGYGIATSLGHTLVATTPALAPLILDPASSNLHRAVSGVSVDAAVSIWIDGRISERLEGALLWTHFGVSGPLILNASRHWERGTIEGRQTSVTLTFLPGLSFDDAERHVLALASARSKATLQTVVSTIVPGSVAAALLDAAGLDREVVAAHLTREDRRRVSHALTAWPLAVVSSRGYNHAEATAGGIALQEIDPSSMESRVCPGLYLTGEILDVDGRIGGFNFQWAWASARSAAQAIAGAPRAPSKSEAD